MGKIKLVFLSIFVICVMSCEFIDEDRIFPFFAYHWQAHPRYDDRGATRSLNVATVSFNVDLSPEVNRNRIVYFIDKINAEHPDVRLILFPETTLGYYYRRSNPAEYQRSIAETIPGITTNVISQKAYEHQIYISFGMVELSGEVLFNSQVLIGPDGLIRSVYRKRNLVPQDRRNGFTEGRDFVLDIIDNIKVATIICADIDSLRVNRDIHRSRAELVLLPVATETSPLNNLLPHNGHLRGY